MKRIISLLLAVCLTLAATAALAEENLDREYTLQEKFQRQMEESGLAGVAKLTVSGNEQWAKALAPLNDVQWNLSGISNDGRFQYDLNAELNGTESCGTWLYGDEKKVYLKSDLLMDTVYSLPMQDDVLSTLTGLRGENPTLYSAVISLLSVPEDLWREKWEPALLPLRQHLETWLDSQMESPAVYTEGGTTLMRVAYHITPDALKAEMKALAARALENTELMELLRSRMSGEQAQLYLSPGYLWYYERIIDGLTLPGNVELLREMTTMGEVKTSRVELPLPENSYGFTELVMNEGEGQTSLRLTAPKQTLQWVRVMDEDVENGTSHQGYLRYIPVDGMGISAHYRARSTVDSGADENDDLYDKVTWALEFTHDLSHLEEEDPTRHSYLSFENLEVRFQIAYSGGRNLRNATQLQFLTDVRQGDSQLYAVCRLRTRYGLDVDELPTSGAVDLTDAPMAKRLEILSDLMTNALLTLENLQPAPTATPVPAATSTDM